MALIAVSAQAANDPNSYAEVDKVRITSVALDLHVAFHSRQIVGKAELNLDWRDKSARELKLDTRGLSIARATVRGSLFPGLVSLWEPADGPAAAEPPSVGPTITRGG